MNDRQPDIIARVRLYRTEEGGRGNVIMGERFSCPFFYEGERFDCRIIVDEAGAPLGPGATAEVPIQFLSPALVKSKLKVGSRFKLWEGKNFADGEVLALLW